MFSTNMLSSLVVIFKYFVLAIMPSDQCVSLRVGQVYLMSGDLQNRFFFDYVEFTGLRLNKPKAFEIVNSTTTVEYAQPFQMRERQSHFNPLNPL
jgi:hypothetical protein